MYNRKSGSAELREKEKKDFTFIQLNHFAARQATLLFFEKKYGKYRSRHQYVADSWQNKQNISPVTFYCRQVSMIVI